MCVLVNMLHYEDKWLLLRTSKGGWKADCVRWRRRVYRGGEGPFEHLQPPSRLRCFFLGLHQSLTASGIINEAAMTSELQE